MLHEYPPQASRMALVNGAPGVVMRDGFGFLTVISFTVDGGRIVSIDAVRNPDKLTAVPDPAGPGPARPDPGSNDLGGFSAT
jgi:hypothetical protein